MRNLVYIATKGNVQLRTTSYSEMQEMKKAGFAIKEVMEEVQPERKIDKERIARRQEYIRNRKKSFA